jgi:hypothetical protein
MPGPGLGPKAVLSTVKSATTSSGTNFHFKPDASFLKTASQANIVHGINSQNKETLLKQLAYLFTTTIATSFISDGATKLHQYLEDKYLPESYKKNSLKPAFISMLFGIGIFVLILWLFGHI